MQYAIIGAGGTGGGVGYFMTKAGDTDCPWPSSGSYERAWIDSGASLGSES